MPTRPSPRSERLGTPNTPAIRFTRGPFFEASLVRHCYGLSGCSPPWTDLTEFPRPPGAFTSRLSPGRSPFPPLDMTTTATGLLCWRDFHPQEWQLASLHQIQPGDIIVVSPWVLHRHRRRWTDPDAFDPERFMPSAPPVDRYTYLPFGLGPRVCIGAHFALAEATLVLSRLLKNFRIELVSSKPVMPIGVVTTQPDHQPPFKLHAREASAA